MNNIDPIQFGKMIQGVEELTEGLKEHKKTVEKALKAHNGRLKALEDFVLILKSKWSVAVLILVFIVIPFFKPVILQWMYNSFFPQLEIAEQISYFPTLFFQ